MNLETNCYRSDGVGGFANGTGTLKTEVYGKWAELIMTAMNLVLLDMVFNDYSVVFPRLVSYRIYALSCLPRPIT